MKNKILITIMITLLSLSGCGDRALKAVPAVTIVDNDGDGYFSDVDPDDNDACNPSLEAGTCDQDNDGLTNAEEITITNTIPTNPDTDSDGLLDGAQEHNATPYSDPLNPCDPNPETATCDRDGDGLTNAQEVIIGTISTNPDTDGDGLLDGTDEHNATSYSNPLDACDPSPEVGACDRDNDGLTNTQEDALGTDRINPDTDGDGALDGEDKNTTASTALKPCLPLRAIGYTDYNNSNTLWQVDNCDGDDYINGAEDNISRGLDNYWSDPYDPNGGCFPNGDLKYCEVLADDGRVWLDRDLGAEEVDCTGPTDPKCYGWLFQWGRSIDTHQERNNDVTQDVNPNEFPYTSPNHEIAPTGLQDWLTSDGTEATSGFLQERQDLWMDTSDDTGCPIGWYVPSKAELGALAAAEGIVNADTAYTSNLKLSLSGSRSHASSAIENAGEIGYLWVTDINATDPSVGNTNFAFTYTVDKILWTQAYRATGYTVRCIKAP